jgi:hypothetical protein
MTEVHHSPHKEASSVHLAPLYLINAHVCQTFSFHEILWYNFYFTTQPPIQWVPGVFPGGKAAGEWSSPPTFI